MIAFDSPREQLLSLLPKECESVDFGVIGINGSGEVRIYNSFEAELAGLSPQRTVGRNLFEEVAPCMNNFMVAQRFQDEARLDEYLDYVFTLKMAPRRVRLRLLASPGEAMRFVLVQPRP